jgi:hypothetical protein
LIHLALAILLAFAGSSAAQGIQKWKTPDGKLYIGSSPPQGSVSVGVAGDHGPERAGQSSPARSPAARAETTRPGAGSVGRQANGEAEPARLTQGSAVVFADMHERNDGSERFLEGAVLNGAVYPVYNVKVCVGGLCRFAVPATLQSGGSGRFSIPLAAGSAARAEVLATWETQRSE